MSEAKSCPAGAYKTERTILVVMQAVKQFEGIASQFTGQVSELLTSLPIDRMNGVVITGSEIH